MPGSQKHKLPDEVLLKIQARLPLVSLVRSRCVCKAWDAAVASPRLGLFQERLECRAGERERMLFLTACPYSKWMDRVVSCAYDATTKRWYHLRLPTSLRTLPKPKFFSGGLGPVLQQMDMLDVYPAWAGGVVLLGLVDKQPGRPVMPYIGNPVLRSWACLPALPDGLQIQHVRGMFVDAAAPSSFKLVAVSDQDRAGERSAFVFDSALGSWRNTTSPALPGPLWRDPGVFVGTVLYCVTGECSLLAYDLERATWSHVAVASPPGFTCDVVCNLISMRGRLLCVALVSRLDHPPKHAIEIWDLDRAGTSWRKVDNMPKTMLDRFIGVSSQMILIPRPIRVVASEDQIYIMRVQGDRIVALDLRHTPGAWKWLPSLPPYARIHVESGGSCLQCFDPCFNPAGGNKMIS